VGTTGDFPQETALRNRFASTTLPSIPAIERLAAFRHVGLIDGKPSVGLAIFQTPTANMLDTANGIRRKMEELKQSFPEGLDYQYGYDTTPFISESIVEVLKTLRDAVILVALVVLVFLQNWRALPAARPRWRPAGCGCGRS